MTEYKVVGKRIPRVDALDKVTGRANFGADVSIPGRLYGKVLRSPHAHARIINIDTTRAKALAGVRAVITAKELAPLLSQLSEATVQEGEIAPSPQDPGILAEKKVVYQGQPVALVAAESLSMAEEALGLIQVEYEKLPAVMDAEEAMKPEAPLIHDNLFTESLAGVAEKPSNISWHDETERGDIKAGFAAADIVLENTFRTQRVHQGYIEPHASTVRVAPDGKITVWTTTQGHFSVRSELAQVLRVPLGRINVIPMEVGGAFGGKLNSPLNVFCVLLSHKTGRPVKMAATRAEELAGGGPAPAIVSTIKMGAKRDGTITAVQMRVILDSGAFVSGGAGSSALCGLGPYRLENLRIDGYAVVTNKSGVGAYRAPGAPQGAFAVECQIDMMAEALGMDPLQLRLKNVAREGDLQANDTPLSRVGYREVLERLAELPAWQNRKKGNNRGWGLACGYWPNWPGGVSSAYVNVNEDGSVALLVGSVDITGTRTSLVQIVAEEMGLSPSEVTVAIGDTQTAPKADVSGGSRIAYVMGTAVQRAAQDAKAQLLQRAAEQLGVAVEGVEYTDKQFRAKGVSEKALSLAELAKKGPIMGKATLSSLASNPALAAHLAEVEVDPDTGSVKLVGYMAVQDVGYAINPISVEGQIQGAVAQGTGWALSEEYCYSQEGLLLNPNLLDYRQPTAMDMPLVETALVEVPVADNPEGTRGAYGLRGVGEVPIVPPLAAIANAINNAVGARIKELPITPEKITQALAPLLFGNS